MTLCALHHRILVLIATRVRYNIGWRRTRAPIGPVTIPRGARSFTLRSLEDLGYVPVVYSAMYSITFLRRFQVKMPSSLPLTTKASGAPIPASSSSPISAKGRQRFGSGTASGKGSGESGALG